MTLLIDIQGFKINARNDSTIPVGPPGGPKIMLAAPQKLWQIKIPLQIKKIKLSVFPEFISGRIDLLYKTRKVFIT